MTENEVNRLFSSVEKLARALEVNSEWRSHLDNLRISLHQELTKQAQAQIKLQTIVQSNCNKIEILLQHRERDERERLENAQSALKEEKTMQRERRWKLFGAATSIGLPLIGVVVWLVQMDAQNSSREAMIHEAREQLIATRKDASVAVQVAAQHGDELNEIRNAITGLNGAISRNADSIVTVATEIGDDRFRRRDWEKERIKLIQELDSRYGRTP